MDTFARPRTFPPSVMELEANRVCFAISPPPTFGDTEKVFLQALKQMELCVHMLDGTSAVVEIHPMSGACEVFSTICFKIHVDDPTEFGLFEVYEKWNLGMTWRAMTFSRRGERSHSHFMLHRA